MTENTSFLGVNIDRINGLKDLRIKKVLDKSLKLLDIIEFVFFFYRVRHRAAL